MPPLVRVDASNWWLSTGCMDTSQAEPAVSGIVVTTSPMLRLAVAAYLARFKGRDCTMYSIAFTTVRKSSACLRPRLLGALNTGSSRLPLVIGQVTWAGPAR